MKRTSSDATLALLTALADPLRLNIVRRLTRDHELPGRQLAAQLGVSRALLCHHAAILVEAGLVARRKQGKDGYLRLKAESLRGSLKGLITGAGRNAAAAGAPATAPSGKGRAPGRAASRAV